MDFFNRQGALIEFRNLLSTDLIKGTGTYRYTACCGKCGGSGYLSCYSYVQAGICFQCNGNAQWSAVDKYYSEQKLAKLNATAEKKRINKQAKADAKIAEHEINVVQPFLKANAELFSNVERVQESRHNDFIGQMMITIKNSSRASQRQLELLASHVTKHDEQQRNMKDVPIGKVEITGTIITVKSQQVDAGYYHTKTVYKMLVECDGYKLWGTVPAKILDTVEESYNELKGKEVTFTATVESKELGFGFYKRPTKARML